jgi:hypothetical protein
MKSIAKGLSYLFHPLFMPLFGLVILLSIPTVSVGFIDTSLYNLLPQYKYYFYGIFALLTLLAPGFSILIMYWSKLISSLEMPDRKERMFPLIFICVYYITVYYKMRMDVPMLTQVPFVLSFVFGLVLTAVVVLVFNFFTKISLHTIGVFGIIGAVTAYFQSQMEYPLLLLMILILIGGLVASARLYLKSHSFTEVMYGMVFGFGIEYFCLNQQLYI